jgi:hypothetical protein
MVPGLSSGRDLGFPVAAPEMGERDIRVPVQPDAGKAAGAVGKGHGVSPLWASDRDRYRKSPSHGPASVTGAAGGAVHVPLRDLAARKRHSVTRHALSRGDTLGIIACMTPPCFGISFWGETVRLSLPPAFTARLPIFLRAGGAARREPLRWRRKARQQAASGTFLQGMLASFSSSSVFDFTMARRQIIR